MILKEYCNRGLLNLVIVDITKRRLSLVYQEYCDQIKKIDSHLNNVNKYLKRSVASIIRDEISQFFEEKK